MHKLKLLVAASSLAALQPLSLAAAPGSTVSWNTVASTRDPVPNSAAGRNYNSFNQPSVNASGLVVFRARSRGGPPEGEPDRGIYLRDMGARNASIETAAGNGDVVPWPNNIAQPPNGEPTGFVEFPSVPRIAARADAIATRGNHQPVWSYTPPGSSETRAGTTGIYVSLDAGETLVTGASKLGVADAFPFFAVPGATATTGFDVFPGSPAITDRGTLVFKGNYTDGVAQTGVFYRRLASADAGGDVNYVQLIADTVTPIPNPGNCAPGTAFGSTAPPSAALDRRGSESAVFVGFDNESAPTCGGIYLARLEASPSLVTLVGLESQVPDAAAGTAFNRFGEGLSYDGRFVAFWGAWGGETRTLRLYCPEEGSQERRDFCNNSGEFAGGGGDSASICPTDGGNCYQEVAIPVNQGIFVHDTASGTTLRVSSTGNGFDDYLYWVYSGHVPATEGAEDDGEVPRWRASAFAAVAGRGANIRVAFKARSGEIIAPGNTYQAAVDGLYLARLPGKVVLQTLLDTTLPGTTVDSQAPPDALISSIGLERDGFRDRWLVVNVSMADPGGEEAEGLAGIYIARVP